MEQPKMANADQKEVSSSVSAINRATAVELVRGAEMLGGVVNRLRGTRPEADPAPTESVQIPLLDDMRDVLRQVQYMNELLTELCGLVD